LKKSHLSKDIYKFEKWERLKPKSLLIEKPEEEELKPSPFISIKFSSKCTPTSASPKRQWTSWTPSSMILSTELPLRDPSLWDLTREELYPLGKFNPLSSLFFQENWQDTPCLRELKQWPNTFKFDLSFTNSCFFSLIIKFPSHFFQRIDLLEIN